MPKLSVLIAARNAALTIGPCVESLLSQEYPDFELLLLDDHSTDGTGAIAQAAAGRSDRFRRLRGRPLPEGWTGRSWACQQLADAARGEYLLFLEAGILAEPGLLARLVATTSKAQRDDLLVGLPRLLSRARGTALLQALTLLRIALFIPLFRKAPPSVAVPGTALLIRRETYRRLGGHAASRGEMIAELTLARLVRRARGRILFCNLAELCRFQEVRTAAQVWRFTVKSLYPAVIPSLPRLLFTSLSLWLLFLLPLGALLAGLTIGISDGDLWVLTAGSVSGLLLGLVPLRAFRAPTWLALLMPFQALLFPAVAGASVWHLWRNQGLRWRRRWYA